MHFYRITSNSTPRTADHIILIHKVSLIFQIAVKSDDFIKDHICSWSWKQNMQLENWNYLVIEQYNEEMS